jgi:hypothetical protein
LHGTAWGAVGFSHHNGRTIDSQRPFAWQDSARSSQIEVLIKTVNLKTDMPLVHEALQRLDRELALARQQRCTVLKLIHGYGSTGAGGDIRIAVQKRLYEMAPEWPDSRLHLRGELVEIE